MGLRSLKTIKPKRGSLLKRDALMVVNPWASKNASAPLKLVIYREQSKGCLAREEELSDKPSSWGPLDDLVGGPDYRLPWHHANVQTPPAICQSKPSSILQFWNSLWILARGRPDPFRNWSMAGSSLQTEKFLSSKDIFPIRRNTHIALEVQERRKNALAEIYR